MGDAWWLHYLTCASEVQVGGCRARQRGTLPALLTPYLCLMDWYIHAPTYTSTYLPTYIHHVHVHVHVHVQYATNPNTSIQLHDTKAVGVHTLQTEGLRNQDRIPRNFRERHARATPH